MFIFNDVYNFIRQKISDEDIICTLKEDIMFINLRHIELLWVFKIKYFKLYVLY